jgi:hypothetical protein
MTLATTTTDPIRIFHAVAACPHCGQHHEFPILVRLAASPAVAEPLFGGPGSGEVAGVMIAFTCPVTRGIINEAVAPPMGMDIVGPDAADAAASANAPVSISPPSPASQSEYAEWVKASRAIAIDFCKSMLTAATGAVPLYIALMTYLGPPKGGVIFASLRVLPPLLFLAAAASYVLALQPRFGLVTADAFAAFRRRRLEWLNRCMLIGSALFGFGLLLTIVLATPALISGPAPVPASAPGTPPASQHGSP